MSQWELLINTSSTSRDFTWQQENCCDEELIDHGSIIQLVQKSVHQHQLMTQMKNHSNMATELWKFIQYSQVIPIVSMTNERTVHSQRLQQVLASWKFFDYKSSTRWELFLHVCCSGTKQLF